jgi:hypothetical protein
LSYRDLGLSLYYRGNLVKLMNADSRQAAELHETARVMILTAQSLRGDKPELDLTMSLIYGSLGEAYQALGNVPKWQESLVQSLNLLENLVAAHPDNSEFARYLGWAHQSLGDFYLDEKKWPAALEQYQACLSVREKLARDDPSKGLYQYDLAWAHHLLGNFYFNPGGDDLESASKYYETAYKLRNQLIQADPTNKRWQKDFALSLEALGDVANRKKDREGALANYEKARSILQKLVEDDLRNGGWASLLSALQKTISRVQKAPTETLSARE